MQYNVFCSALRRLAQANFGTEALQSFLGLVVLRSHRHCQTLAEALGRACAVLVPGHGRLG